MPADAVNLLPYDGFAGYFGPVMAVKTADTYFKNLIESIAWQHDEVVVFGKKFVMKRKTGWYGDQPFDYTYSGNTRTAEFWTDDLLELKKIAENITGESYNSCLLNLYHDGTEGMSWHSDDEKMLKENGAICSMSFGAERKFSFKHKQSKETRSIFLEHGSLLVMKAEIQRHWVHSLPKTSRVKLPRINLTFRTIN